MRKNKLLAPFIMGLLIMGSCSTCFALDDNSHTPNSSETIKAEVGDFVDMGTQPLGDATTENTVTNTTSSTNKEHIMDSSDINKYNTSYFAQSGTITTETKGGFDIGFRTTMKSYDLNQLVEEGAWILVKAATDPTFTVIKGETSAGDDMDWGGAQLRDEFIFGDPGEGKVNGNNYGIYTTFDSIEYSPGTPALWSFEYLYNYYFIRGNWQVKTPIQTWYDGTGQSKEFIEWLRRYHHTSDTRVRITEFTEEINDDVDTNTKEITAYDDTQFVWYIQDSTGANAVQPIKTATPAARIRFDKAGTYHIVVMQPCTLQEVITRNVKWNRYTYLNTFGLLLNATSDSYSEKIYGDKTFSWCMNHEWDVEVTKPGDYTFGDAENKLYTTILVE